MQQNKNKVPMEARGVGSAQKAKERTLIKSYEDEIAYHTEIYQWYKHKKNVPKMYQQIRIVEKRKQHLEELKEKMNIE